MKTKIKKNQIPIDVDLHLKYRCSNPDCGIEHWISLKEAKTLNFKVVCDCDWIIKPKRVKSIKIKYANLEKPKNQQLSERQNEKENIPTNISKNLLNKCISIMQNFGFTSKEAEASIIDYYSKNPIDDPISLVKNTISSLEN